MLLVDTNFSSQPIREYLLAQGHDVWLMGGNASDFLAKQTHQYVLGDYSQPGAIENVVNQLQIDYLVPGCNDLSDAQCAHVAAQRGFPGYDPEPVVKQIHHKQLFRHLGRQLGLSMPALYESPSQWLGKPVILKPANSFSGKGVVRAQPRTEDEQVQLLDNAASFSPTGEVVVEDFVEGELYSSSCFVSDGKIIEHQVVHELCGVNPWVVDTSYVVRDELPEALGQELVAQLSKLVSELSLADGLLATVDAIQDTTLDLSPATALELPAQHPR